MNSPRYDVYESFAYEKNSRILKTSNDARVLRSLSKESEVEPSSPSTKASRPKLVSILASLLVALKRQPA